MSQNQEINEEKKERKEYSEALFDLTSLQREANSRFGFRAQQTLQITQGLYQPRSGEGYITYPRTDSRRLPDDYPSQVIETLGKFKNSKYNGLTVGGSHVKPQAQSEK